MTDDILVSISCIAYNHERYIANAIEGFLKQKTSFKFEVLIYDDASTDSTASIIKEYQKKFPHIIKPIYQIENQYSKGRRRFDYIYNHTRARGKYIALCEGDDYWIDPYKLQKQVDFMETHPDCSVSFHAAEIRDARTNTQIGLIRPYNKSQVLSDKRLFFGGGHFAPTASLLYKKNSLDSPPDFFYDCPVGDHAMALVLSSRGKVCYIDEVMSVRNLWVPNSFMTKYRNDWTTEKKTAHLSKMIMVLESFNDYTKGKWSKDVAKLILGYKLEILFMQSSSSVNILKDPEFKNLIRKLGWFEQIKFYSRVFAPAFYKKLSTLKYCVAKKYLKKEIANANCFKHQ